MLVMKMKKKKIAAVTAAVSASSRSVSAAENDGSERGFSAGELSRLGLIKKAKISRRRRLRIRRLKQSCEETEEKLTELSLSSSSYPSSSEKSPEDSPGTLRENSPEKSPPEKCVTTHGSVSVVGRRTEMEDAVRVEEGLFKGERFDFFGVYDGHGGSRVAEACKERLHEVLMEVMEGSSGGGGGWERVMEECFERMDEEVNRGLVTEDMVGSTAVVAVVNKEVVVVANCGDSRAVLSKGGAVVPLSVDHKV